MIIVYCERDSEPLVAPISAGDVLGEITVLRDGETVETVPLVATSSITMSKAAYIKSQISETLHNSTLSKIIKILVILFVIYILWVIIYRVRHIIHLNSVRKARRERARRIAEQEAVRNDRRYAGAGHSASPDIDFFSDRPDNSDNGDSGDIEAQPYQEPQPGEPIQDEWTEDAPQSGSADAQADGDQSQIDAGFFQNLFKK